MTRAERLVRREAAARAIEDGATAGETCIKYGISYGTLKNLCRARGLDVGKLRIRTASSFAVLKSMLDGEIASSVAIRFGITRQRVSQIKQAAIAGGFTELKKGGTDVE